MQQGGQAKSQPLATPAATVVLPSFNQGRYLAQALASVVGQRYPIELIVVDGGSTDETPGILQAWEDRFAWWRSGPDSGQSAAINEGMAHGTAPFVAWLNSDDWYLPGGLDRLIDALAAHPDAPGVYAETRNADAAGRIGNRYFTQEFTETNLARRCIVSQPATLVRRSVWEALGGLDPNLHYAMDYDLWWRVYRGYGPLVRVRHDVAVNRIHTETKTQSARREQVIEAMRVVRRHCGHVPLKWYVAWPYSVWWKTLSHAVKRQFTEGAA